MISIYHTQEGDIMSNCYYKKAKKFSFYFAINLTFLRIINSAYLFLWYTVYVHINKKNLRKTEKIILPVTIRKNLRKKRVV